MPDIKEGVSLLELLKEEHERLRTLFEEAEGEDGEAGYAAAREAVALIARHDKIERRMLYPEAMEASADLRDVVLRSKEAHHVAGLLILELRAMPESRRFFAKFAQLAKGVLAHMREEEEELFPRLEKTDLDFIALGREASEYREKLASRPAAAVPLALVAVCAAAALAAYAYRRR